MAKKKKNRSPDLAKGLLPIIELIATYECWTEIETDPAEITRETEENGKTPEEISG